MPFCDPMIICSCCYSETDKVQRRISQTIDLELQKHKKYGRKEFKLLLLGTGEAGKSTVLKQMQIIHGNNFQDADKRKEFVRSIHENVMESIMILLAKMKHFDISFERVENAEIAQRVRANIKEGYNMQAIPDLFAAVLMLWQDAGVQACYGRRLHFKFVYLSDSAVYFLNQIETLADPEFVPTVDDVLRVRKSTTGIIEYSFKISHVYFRIVDVGGQKTERRKWIHCFEDVTAVVFISALSDYDQYTLDPGAAETAEQSFNRLEESLALFNVVLSERSLQNAFIILFLNKTDVFQEKIQHRPIENHFPEYKDFVPIEDHIPSRVRRKHIEKTIRAELTKSETEKPQQFIRQKFVNHVWKHAESQTESVIRRRGYEYCGSSMLYSHFTCATDTTAMKTVAASVEDNILQVALAQYNIT